MSSSQELVAELMAAGMSKAEIARAVGRDSSVVSQITSGAKPYRNLIPTLEAVRDNRVRGRERAVPEAPRRTNAAGQAARVRGKTRRAGGRNVLVGRQAAASGARSILRMLREAAEAGMRVAWTVTYPKRWRGAPVPLGKSPKYKPSKAHHAVPASERTQTIDLGNSGRGYSAAMWLGLAEAAGGNVSEALSTWITAQGLGDVDGVPPLAIELRTWLPRGG